MDRKEEQVQEALGTVDEIDVYTKLEYRPVLSLDVVTRVKATSLEDAKEQVAKMNLNLRDLVEEVLVRENYYVEQEQELREEIASSVVKILEDLRQGKSPSHEPIKLIDKAYYAQYVDPSK